MEFIEKIISFIFLFGVILFIVSTIIITYHFHNYRTKKDGHGLLISMLVIGTCVLLFVEFIAFFAIDWQNLALFMEDYLPTISTPL